MARRTQTLSWYHHQPGCHFSAVGSEASPAAHDEACCGVAPGKSPKVSLQPIAAIAPPLHLSAHTAAWQAVPHAMCALLLVPASETEPLKHCTGQRSEASAQKQIAGFLPVPATHANGS